MKLFYSTGGRLITGFFAIFILLFPWTLIAQETSGSLTGRIVNDEGMVNAGATVEAIHNPSGTKYSLATDATGYYTITNMRIGGPYSITVRQLGMKPQVIEDIQIRLGAAQVLNIQLEAELSKIEEVLVRARMREQRADQYGTGKNINTEQIQSTPTINRSITDITRTTPQGSRDNSFAGTNFRYNNVTVDGAINNDAIGFSPSLGGQTGTSGMAGSSTRTNPIALDAIQDIQVYLAPYDVKIGNFTGGSVNAVTRSGNNSIEGSVYGYGRAAAVTGADRVGDLGKMNTDFYDYQTGIRIGFPILKNKLFFFTNEEFTRRQDPTQLMVGTAETAHILSEGDADAIAKSVTDRYGNIFNAGTAGIYSNWNRSLKFFNRLDWNINEQYQLIVRNNTILSKASHMDRDQQDFRFSSMAFEQTNNQSSTVAELKGRFNNAWSGNALIGYTIVNDNRNPLSDPSLPQVQIQGRTPGTTIYLGTDREASVFDMQQKTMELTANVHWNYGRHRVLFGTHNELYNIRYGFVNGWNGRVDYNSIDDFITNNPYRVRGSYNYNNNSRDYITQNPAAKFDVQMYSLYVQDEIRIHDRLQVTPGLRADFTYLPNRPDLSDKVKNMFTDPNFGMTYDYTPVNRIQNDFLNRVQFSPRIGFRWGMRQEDDLVLRGGAGLFTGRIPFAWLAYAYYNTGMSYGAFDQRADQKTFATGSDAIKPSKNGLADFISQNGAVINDRNSGKTQVDLLDNGFTLPQVFRASLALDYETADDWKFTLEGLYTKNIKDVLFQQINTKDNARWYGYDKEQKQPYYSGAVDNKFANVYLLSNTNEGYRFSVSASIAKQIANLLDASVSYTYGESKDLSNGVRNSMESNWQLNQSLVPNNPRLAYSNFDIRHRLVAQLRYKQGWRKFGSTQFSLFISAQSGSPFTYGIVNNSIQGLPQQASLVYIPKADEAIRYFKDLPSGATAVDQAAAFNDFINGNEYLNSRRGLFTERNAGRTPWNTQADLQIAHALPISKAGRYVTISLDVINLTNLLNRNWGIQTFSPNTFNSTSSVGLVPTLFPQTQNQGGWPVFTFEHPGKPYSTDYFNSRTQMQFGVRYTF